MPKAPTTTTRPKAPTPPPTVDGTPSVGPDAEGEPVASTVYYDEFWQGLAAEAKDLGFSLSRGETYAGGRVATTHLQTFTAPQVDENGTSIGTSLVGEFKWTFNDRPLTTEIYAEARGLLGLNPKTKPETSEK